MPISVHIIIHISSIPLRRGNIFAQLSLLRNFECYVSYEQIYGKEKLALPGWCSYMDKIFPDKVEFLCFLSEISLKKQFSHIIGNIMLSPR